MYAAVASASAVALVKQNLTCNKTLVVVSNFYFEWYFILFVCGIQHIQVISALDKYDDMMMLHILYSTYSIYIKIHHHHIVIY